MGRKLSLNCHVSMLLSVVLVLGYMERLSAESVPLPEPLTLDFALSLVDEAVPQLQIYDAQQSLARAEQKIAEAETGFKLNIEGRLRWFEPSDISYDRGPDDHRLSLVARKNLYDFGRSSARNRAAEESFNSHTWLYQNSRLQRRISIMEQFFSVLLADLEAARDTEALSVTYVQLDRLKNRHELGQVSDIELYEMESRYQKSRRLYTISQNRQRSSRSQLAITLNSSASLPAELAVPDLPQISRALPEYERLVEKGLRDNTLLQARRAEVRAAQERVDMAKAGSKPKLEGLLEANEYSREMGSHDTWRAGVEFAVPLYTGGSVEASIAKEQARLYESQARLREAEDTIRQTILDLWLELQELRVQREEMIANQEFRDLYLDQSRSRYEMEVQADLGDAMVRLSEAELGRKRTEYLMAIAWEKLDALTGGPVDDVTLGSGISLNRTPGPIEQDRESL
jgi:outer membrane protein TolC